MNTLAATGADDLRETAVIADLNTSWLGRRYLFLPETDSTNEVLAEMVRGGGIDEPPAGTVVLTDYQRRGRGRFQRRWEAPAGSSLLLSMLFRPRWPALHMGWLGMIVSCAAVNVIENVSGVSVGIKWPNDLVVQQAGAWRKVSGLLAEGEIGGDGNLQHVIVGLGLNVNIPAALLPDAVTPASSLLEVSDGKLPLARRPLLVALLAAIERGYDAAAAGRSPHAAWEKRLVNLDQSVQVTHTQSGICFVGEAVGTDPWGRLQVIDDQGKMHVVSAGEVSLRPF